MAACRLVIADDHPLFRDALRLTASQALPDAEIVEAGSFESLKDALEATPEADLVLLDLNMPGMLGLSGLLFVRAAFSAVAVAIISANEEPRVIRQALELGAMGYIPKSTAPAEIRTALAALLAGEMWLPTGSDLNRRGSSDDAELVSRLASLTPQQVRVLMMLSEGLLNKQIAHALYVSEATIKAHVSAILEKLGVDNRTQAVIIAQRLVVDAAQSDALGRAAGLEASR
ncbi:MAG: response regulator transcription factor [Alphaproteobacteria bacterium]|nr:response regulator transcription factor [Alphaproteobacteria bacterium]